MTPIYSPGIHLLHRREKGTRLEAGANPGTCHVQLQDSTRYTRHRGAAPKKKSGTVLGATSFADGIVTRAVLVTGGTGALGAAVTNRFLEEGHKVVATSLTGQTPDAVAKRLSRFEERFHPLQADVTDQDSVAELVDRTVVTLGTIDVLIHLVGGWAGGHPVQDISLETWERMFDLNLRSSFLCTRAAIPVMREQGWGRIVLVSSRAARSGRRNQGAYAIVKAGVSVLAETIAEENNDVDVTANKVAPSVLDTPANRTAMPGTGHGSLVSVEDVAKTIAFLASQEAGQLRGAWLSAFGGM